MEGELNAAREIQIGMLPPPDGAPSIFGFTASAFLDPAKKMGGDLYDFFTTPGAERAARPPPFLAGENILLSDPRSALDARKPFGPPFR